MKIRDGFILREVSDQPVVVAVGAASEIFNGMIRLNDTSAFLFDLLKKDRTEEDLVNALVEKYDVDEETAKKDVEDFIEVLAQPGIIE